MGIIKDSWRFVTKPFRFGYGDIKESYGEMKDTNRLFSEIRKANKILAQTSKTQIVDGYGSFFVEMKTKSGDVLVVNQKGKIVKDLSGKYLPKIKNIKKIEQPIKVNDNVDCNILFKFVDIEDKYLTPEQIITKDCVEQDATE